MCNKKKKILVITNMYPSKKYPHYGIFVLNSVDILIKNGNEVGVVYLQKQTKLIKKVIAYFIFYLKSIVLGLFGGYEVIYAHYASHTAIPVLLIKLINKKMKVVVNVHGNDIVPETNKDLKFEKLVSKLLAKANIIICPSNYFSEIVNRNYNVCYDKIEIYPSGGVNTNKFKKLDKQIALDHFGLSSDHRYIGYVSRIEEKKGWDLFLKACSDIIKLNSDIKLIVVGDGSQARQYDQMVRDLMIDNKIIKFQLLDEDELVYVYNVLDIFVFPTYRKSESLGLVGLEAMACETVVIASDKYGPASYINDNYNGYQFMTNNAEELKNTILKVLHTNNTVNEDIKKNARFTVEKYSLNNTYQKLISIFDKL